MHNTQVLDGEHIGGGVDFERIGAAFHRPFDVGGTAAGDVVRLAGIRRNVPRRQVVVVQEDRRGGGHRGVQRPCPVMEGLDLRVVVGRELPV